MDDHWKVHQSAPHPHHSVLIDCYFRPGYTHQSDACSFCLPHAPPTPHIPLPIFRANDSPTFLPKGSIKKSRPVFADLIDAIDEAAKEQSLHTNEPQRQLDKARMTVGQLSRELAASRARELCLLYELYETKQKLAKLTGEKVLPLRPHSASDDDAGD